MDLFRGMNIHLPAILMFTRGTRFWHTAIYPANHISGDSIHFPHFSGAMPRRLGERHVELLQRLIHHGEIRDAVSETFERSLDQDGARAAASRQRWWILANFWYMVNSSLNHHNYGRSHFLNNITIYAIFNSYVSLPEGNGEERWKQRWIMTYDGELCINYGELLQIYPQLWHVMVNSSSKPLLIIPQEIRNYWDYYNPWSGTSYYHLLIRQYKRDDRGFWTLLR